MEAGTGVGKSMAYLLPAALTARKNNIAIGVATKTNALLDQLMYKELPLLNDALKRSAEQGEQEAPSGEVGLEECSEASGESEQNAPEPTEQSEPTSRGIDYAALKGFSHYPCLRQINRIVIAGPKTRNVAGKDIVQAPSLAGLLSFIEQSEYDDIELCRATPSPHRAPIAFGGNARSSAPCASFTELAAAPSRPISW